MLPSTRDQYLRLLGFNAPLPADLASLRALHRAHITTVPFENLDIHLGVPIVLDASGFVDKVVHQRRGGFCFELNGAFAALLDAVGYQVDLLEGQVYGDAEMVRFGHMCLRVTLDQTYLVDVGFGRAFDEPIEFTTRADQIDSAGTFRLADRDDGWLDLYSGAHPTYLLSPVPRALEDFAPGCTFHQTSPSSPFTQGTLCTLRTVDGRCTLAGLLLIETVAGQRAERTISGDELGTVLRERFEISLSDDDLATLRARLEG